MKKILMVITPLFFLITIYLIVDTYSLFESNHVTTINSDIAKWQIKLNGDVIDGASSTFSVDFLDWDGSEYVLDGKVSPGMNGFFDVEIDPNMSDVSVRYDISFDFETLSASQFVINDIIEMNGREMIRTDEYTYTGILSLDDIKKGDKSVVRVSLTWVNDEANNEADSILASTHGNKLKIPVVVTLWQYNNEEIVEYSS